MSSIRNVSEGSEKKTSYRKPTVKSFGSLKDLTTGGTGTAKEGSTGQKPRP